MLGPFCWDENLVLQHFDHFGKPSPPGFHLYLRRAPQQPGPLPGPVWGSGAAEDRSGVVDGWGPLLPRCAVAPVKDFK